MFDIGWSELLVIGVVALGHWMGKVRRMASEFQDQFREAMREAEVADLKRQFDEASAKATSTFNNPLETAQKEVEAAFGSEPTAIDQPALATADPGAVEPSAIPETPPSVVPEPAVATADAPVDIKPDAAKQSGSGAP